MRAGYASHHALVTSALTLPGVTVSPFFDEHQVGVSQFPGRTYSTQAASYYDVLKISPKASRKQVKMSYFALSKQYHPDVNTSSDAAKHFALIAEAYSILGNVHKRREYDRGFYSHATPHHSTESAEHDQFFRKRGSFFRKEKPPTGRSHIYNFDEFYRKHYEESVQDAHKAKHGMDDISQHIKDEQDQAKETKSFVLVYSMLIVGLFFLAIK